MFGNYEGGEQRVYPLNDTLLQLKEFYTGAEILRFLRRSSEHTVRDSLQMLHFLGDTVLRRAPAAPAKNPRAA